LSAKKPYLNKEWIAKELAIHGNAKAIANHHGFHERTIQRQVQKFKKSELNKVALEMLELPHPVEPLSTMQEIVLRGRGLVSSDWHIPLISHEVAAKMIDDAMRFGCTDWLIIAGDLFNLDALSRYSPKQAGAGMEVEMVHAQRILEIMLRVFKKIIITKGNHDNRVMESLGYRLRFEQTVKMLLPDMTAEDLSKIHVTGLDYALVESGVGTWYICHTNQYSKIPLTVPRELCDIHQMHIAAGHRHHHAIGRNKGGQHWCVELGGLFDDAKTAYLRQYTTTFPKWTPGYMLLSDGVPYLPMLSPAPNHLLHIP
jgi:predicted phosphodiesterase